MEKSNNQNSGSAGIFRSVWSVFAGLLVLVLLATIAFTAVAGNFPKEYRIPVDQPPPVWITQTYTTVLLLGSILAGFVTAKIAKRAELKHVLVLAVLWMLFYFSSWRSGENTIIFEAARSLIHGGLAVLGGYLYVYRQHSTADRSTSE